MAINLIFYIPMLLFFLACSFCFSASEASLFSLSHLDLAKFKQEQKPAGLLIVSFLKTPRRLLVTILFGNTLVNIGFFCVSTLAAVSLEKHDGEHLGMLISGFVSVAAVILCGEVLPKALAVQKPVAFASILVFFLLVVFKILGPVTNLLDRMTIFFCQIFGVTENRGKYLTSPELKQFLDLSEQQGLLDTEEHEMLLEVVDLQELRAKELMIPRVDVIKAPADSSYAQVFDLFRRTKLSKICIYERYYEDEVIGIVEGKDFLLNPTAPLKTLVKKIPFIPETMRLESLLKLLREESKTAAVVVDEYGGIAGLVTLEDLVAELVGESDIARQGQQTIQKTGPNSYRIAGSLPLNESDGLIATGKLPYRCHTIAGLVTLLLQKLPAKGDQVIYQNLRITVLDVQKHRVTEVMLEILDKKDKG